MSLKDLLSSIKVSDIMSTSLISVNMSVNAMQIAKMMEQGGIGAVIVKDADKPAGIITDRDFATRIAANGLPLDTPAKDIMSSPLVSIDAGSTLVHAAQIMSDKKIRKLAVCLDGGVVGIVTSTDIVNHLAK